MNRRPPVEVRLPATDGSDDAAEPSERDAARFDLVVADAGWNWTERLFTPLAAMGPRVFLIKACDWRNALIQRRPVADWFRPLERLDDALWQRQFVLPPGWMKSYPRLGMRPLSRAVRSWHEQLPEPQPLALVVAYPHYLYLRDLVQPDFLIYYNMDDYGFYWTSRRRALERLERRVVREADLSVFCARIRAEESKAMVPEAADRIVHLPHGAPASAIAAEPQSRPAPAPHDLAGLPRPLLGFVGTLEDRIDWPLLEYLAREFPEGSLVLIGREPAPAPREEWYQAYRRTLSLPNVHHLGWRSQAEIGRYNAAFDVCLIPYRCDHPFNRVSCPTKVMDYMATSRPVVSTPIPECRLYAHLFDLAETPQAFVAAVRRVVERGSDDGRAVLRWRTARAATWEQTAATLLHHIEHQMRF